MAAPETLCRILVPDLSPSSDGALDYACLLAHRVRGTVELLHVQDACLEAGSTDRDGAVPPEPLAPLIRQGSAEFRHRMEFGDVCEAIVRVATTEAFDLIIIGDGGAAGEGGQDFGSIARRVAHSVKCPVIKVRSTLRPRGGATDEGNEERAQRSS